jgi:hypothetical protein
MHRSSHLTLSFAVTRSAHHGNGGRLERCLLVRGYRRGPTVPQDWRVQW